MRATLNQNKVWTPILQSVHKIKRIQPFPRQALRTRQIMKPQQHCQELKTIKLKIKQMLTILILHSLIQASYSIIHTRQMEILFKIYQLIKQIVHLLFKLILM
jgi:hypothetical protein